MSNNQFEELGPRNKLSSNPSPLIQLDGKPLAPEVSVLLDKEKAQFVSRESPFLVGQNKGGKPIPSYEDLKQIKLNQKESYGTWKSKNDQMYPNTYGDGKSEVFNKPSQKPSQYNNPRNKNMGSDIITFSTQDGYDFHTTSKEETNKKNSSVQDHYFRQPDYNTRDSYNYDNSLIPGNEICSEHLTYENDQQYNKNATLPQIPGKNIIYKSSQEYGGPLSMPNISVNSRQYNTNHPYVQSSIPCFVDMQESNKFIPRHQHIQGIKSNCQCAIPKSITLANSARVGENRTGIKQQIEKKDVEFQPSSELNLSQINGQIIDLHNLIHHQNEQILMLKQQILEIHYDCLKRFQQKLSCHQCLCDAENVKECLKERSPHNEGGFVAKRSIGIMTVPLETNVISKRSIGVMTAPLQFEEYNPPSNSSTKKDTKLAIETIKHKDLEPKYRTLVHHREKNPNQNKMIRQEEGRKIAQYDPTSSNKKKSKGNSKTARTDNSFSLNEAELLIRTSIEQEDMSPNSSVHVDMQEYYSSSTGSDYSDTDESVSEEDSQSRSDLEIESTGPQFGHTFYNLVVDQVNKIVQPPHQRQEQIMGTRRVVANNVYEVNEDYGMENNWSKRVTFDGPPLEDSDNQIPNLLQVPRLNQQKHIQDYKGVPDRMKDFLLYNIADGSTNLSIASLRYLERYNLPPSQPTVKNNRPVYQEKHSRKYKKREKKKSSAVERDSNLPQQCYNKRINANSSKLLDITALKQQPKLF